MRIHRVLRTSRRLLLAAGLSVVASCNDAPKGTVYEPLDAAFDDAPDACVELNAFVDADGDGLGSAPASVRTCTGEPPPGFSRYSGDCNDQDPALRVWAYPDVDRDGFGSSDGRQCLAEDAPSGSVSLPGDCDDADDTRYPDAPEQWFDGIDSDCSGDDDPEDCDADASACGCQEALAARPSVLPNPDCAGKADLLFLNVVRCMRCGRPEIVYVVVGNAGSVDAPAGSTVQAIVADKQTLPIALPGLKPGEATLPLMLDTEPGRGVLQIQPSGVEDCDASNDQMEALIVQVDCR